jgi:alpha/beta superfamily hydrolase
MSPVDRLPPPPAAPVRSPAAVVAGEREITVAPSVALQGGEPSIEARVHVPERPRRAVLVCHPHPLYGGSMHSPVPLAVARYLAEVASDVVAWARFNFRGVGASGGTYDEGRGELGDARAVLAQLREQCPPGCPVSIFGHSFGAWVGFRLALETPDVERALLAAPTAHFAFPAPPPGRGLRTTVFIGDRDELSPLESARSIGVAIGAEVRVFEGYDHHFLKSRRALAQAALPVIAPEAATP